MMEYAGAIMGNEAILFQAAMLVIVIVAVFAGFEQ